MTTLFDWDSLRTQVFSYGGGVNSVAIAVLIARGKLPRPNLVVMDDTAREGSATWGYLDEVMRPYFAAHGLAVEIAPHDLATVDLYGHNGDILLPLYTTQSGEQGKLPTFCSGEWKRDVMRRYLRRVYKVEACDVWIGYTIDEAERVAQSKLKWERRVWPLLDLMLTRGDCLKIIAEDGLPAPPRSACWMCPHRDNSDWRYLRDEYPEDFDRACQLEAEIRAGDAHLWLHEACVPLAEADIEQDNDQDHTQCGLGMCFL